MVAGACVVVVVGSLAASLVVVSSAVELHAARNNAPATPTTAAGARSFMMSPSSRAPVGAADHDNERSCGARSRIGGCSSGGESCERRSEV